MAGFISSTARRTVIPSAARNLLLLFGHALFAIAAIHAQVPARRTVSPPEELTTQIEKDFDLPDCFEEGTPPLDQKIKVEEVDLTKTAATLLVSATGQCLQGSKGNAPFLVYARFGNNWRDVLKADGETVEPLASMYNGWHEIQVTYRNSDAETVRYMYKFAKNEYQGVSCEVLTKGSDARKPCPGWKAK
jgi:hypothetical protein